MRAKGKGRTRGRPAVRVSAEFASGPAQRAGGAGARTGRRKTGKRRTHGARPGKPAEVLLTFRAREPGDDAFILQLTEAELDDVHQQSFGVPFPREQFLAYLRSGAPTVVVERDGKPIGYYSYLIAPDGKMHVSAMVIDPAHQSEGIGTRVMQHMEDEARAHGVHTMEVFVQANNEKSLAFTRKLGFVERFRVAPHSICFQKPVAGVAGPEGPAPGTGVQPAQQVPGIPLGVPPM
ncbi:GNAT family N-acetyltransferase [Alicyclobacillus macrosporangiidus]|uniref:Ribosomal protein S18 acetylase RimI n=1 Tax=Alicyclobacillus macrosporangiidus TaxID=392015 RepID=A0A1I7FI25_9BACL|nr:GNAT family N-acetyltransferase [Alicyclobacillus macrosporangiidus]SFU35814.1 Ribosomal protein S18 acetylase RimI [Alicyclobacillus macrosporangiidus]